MKHNHLAVWVMIIANQALGALTYMFIVKNPWTAGQPDRSPDEYDSSDPTPYIADIVGTILMCYFLSWLVNKLNISTANAGFMLGLYAAFGLVVKAVAGHYFFLGHTPAVTIIDTMYTMIAVIITATVLGAWRKNESVNA